MFKLLRLAVLGLALSACSPQAPPVPRENVSYVLLEFDPAKARTGELLNSLSRSVRDALRASPLIAVAPDGRKVVDDHLQVTLMKPEDSQAAVERIAPLSASSSDKTPQATVDYDITRPSDGVIEIRFTADGFARLEERLLASTVEVSKRRTDNLGFPTVVIIPQPPNRLRVEAPGFNVRQLDRLIDVLTRPGVLTFNLVDILAVPDDYTTGEERGGRIALPNIGMNGELQVLFSDAIITGSDLAGANQGTDQSNRPNIQFRLHPSGAKKFGKATTENIGRPFAIVLDDRIITAPNIQAPIMTGSGEITGNFTIEGAEQLAIVLRSGALPVKLFVVERHIVP